MSFFLSLIWPRCSGLCFGISQLVNFSFVKCGRKNSQFSNFPSSGARQFLPFFYFINPFHSIHLIWFTPSFIKFYYLFCGFLAFIPTVSPWRFNQLMWMFVYCLIFCEVLKSVLFVIKFRAKNFSYDFGFLFFKIFQNLRFWSSDP